MASYDAVLADFEALPAFIASAGDARSKRVNAQFVGVKKKLNNLGQISIGQANALDAVLQSCPWTVEQLSLIHI